MEENKTVKPIYNKRLFWVGAVTLAITLLFLIASFFIAKNLSAYFGITFVLFSVGLALVSFSGYFGDRLPGAVISGALLISGMFLFCFSFVKISDGKESAVVYNETVSSSISVSYVSSYGDSNEATTSASSATGNSKSEATESADVSSKSTSSKSVSSATSSKSVSANSSSSKSVISTAESSSATVTNTLDIEVLSELSFKRNQTATVTVKGKANTLYSIEVYYSSGKSTAAGLEDKTSDENGQVSWTFKVGGRTTPGEYKMIISDGNETAELKFTVE